MHRQRDQRSHRSDAHAAIIEPRLPGPAADKGSAERGLAGVERRTGVDRRGQAPSRSRSSTSPRLCLAARSLWCQSFGRRGGTSELTHERSTRPVRMQWDGVLCCAVAWRKDSGQRRSWLPTVSDGRRVARGRRDDRCAASCQQGARLERTLLADVSPSGANGVCVLVVILLLFLQFLGGDGSMLMRC